MLASKLFPLLARPEVQEIVLLSGKPPCAMVNGTYRRLSSQVLKDDDILGVVVAARGQEQLPHLAQGAQWDFQMPAVGRVSVMAGYEATLLRMTLRVAQSRSVRDLPAVRPDMQLFTQADVAPSQGGWSGPSLKPAPPQRPAPPPPAAARQPAPMSPQAAFGELELDEPAPPVREQVQQPAPRAVQRRIRRTGEDIVDVLLGRARELLASDLHLLSERPAMLRIAGELVPQPEVTRHEDLEPALLARVPPHLSAVLEQHGSCDFPLVHPEYGRFRANVGRQRSGIKLTARPIGLTVPTLAQLGLPESLAAALHHHQGLIVITGPTGHGKTSTLAALVGILNRETSHHVITVEDPIEYVHETAQAVISQREVGSHTKSFAAALKGALREDPDVIVVGELRDTETVRMALSASETGHLVISTMNTPSAAKAIERLIDLFPPGDQPQVRMTLAGGLRMIVSQRILPTADRSQLCAAAELLPGSTPLWSLIRENRTYQIASLQQRGKSIGIVRLDDSLSELVRSGRTTLEIAREYAESTELLDTLVSGRSPRAVAAAAAAAQEAAEEGALQKKGIELGKQVMSRAGKFFGGDNK